jgi:hypothetical protein
MRKCKSPNVRPKRELAIFEWPVRKHKKAPRGALKHFYRRARRNQAELARDGWLSRKEMDNA